MSAIKGLYLDLIERILNGDTSVRETLIEFANDPNGLLRLSPVLRAVALYLMLGFSVAPQRPGAKSPCVKWKRYQDEQPLIVDCYDWWYRQWPDAGIAIVLGPVSDLFVIDVDGPEAHDELVRRLGEVPMAPMVKSGSGKKHRYHLLFQHPDVATKAKATPWHPHVSAIYRYTSHGCRGVFLESMQAGSVRSTSREAVARYFERLTEQTILAAQRAPKPSDVEAVKAGQLLDKTLFKSRRNPNGRGEGGQSK